MANSEILIAVGILFLAGLLLDKVGRIVHVPRVTLLILLGAVVGPPLLDWLPHDFNKSDEFYAPTALTMVAFLLGGSLSPETLKSHGREIMIISLTLVAVSVAVVATGLWLIGLPVGIAVLLGGMSAATDPAATHDVITQAGAKGRFATNLLGIVAIDDAWGLLAFSMAMTLAGIMVDQNATMALIHGATEVGGAIALGLAIGLPAAFLTGRIKPGEPTLIEAIGLVFLCAGLALHFQVSFLLTGMVCGTTIVNLARHHDRPFHEIERIEWPFMLLFFVMAGASLKTGNLMEVGYICIAYFILRAFARLLGGWAGGRLAGLPHHESRMTGLGLMPQAGVAIGMALVASERFPEIGELLLAVAVASTIAFELIGPFLTQTAIRRVSPA
ncbi:cation:proton antiporter [Hoeflea alexandrii]|uniref:Cation:proton antiporter n=2 Tax=Hoeflea alexandrii TaxID=288436 RepID=A0ABT1CM89_9HYPH|nr:cation:proton antiporter [Hoeflea alexandrii]MCO6406670.1 cation:proton antiporter [Hoeflea alexandrii]